jgi:hypothetical protein
MLESAYKLRKYIPGEAVHPMADHADRLLGGKLIQALHDNRGGGGPYPITLAELAAKADAQSTPQQIEKALSKKAMAAQVVRARKNDPASPIALREDTERLACSPLLLEYALGRVCSAAKPLHPASRLLSQVDKSLREAFGCALAAPLAENAAGESVGVQQVKGRRQFFLRAFPPPPPIKHPAELVGEQLLRVLLTRRDQDQEYPVALDVLVALAAPEAPLTLVKQAIGREPFRSEAVVAVRGKADTPVALNADRNRFAAGPRVLEYLLGLATTLRRPLVSPARLEELLLEDLRTPFSQALASRLESHDLPEAVGAFIGLEGPQLFLKTNLPPSAALAWKLLRALEARRRMGDYPLTLESLAAEADPFASPDLLARALKDKVLKPHLLQALPGNPRSPVALSEDAERLGDWAGLLELAVEAARTAENQAVGVGDLKKKVARPLQKVFAAALDRRLNEHALPAGVGLLQVKRAPLFFLVSDVGQSWPKLPESPAEPAQPGPKAVGDFLSRFEDAFRRLDAARGGNNLVSLVSLREALGDDRDSFDTGLGQLRRQGRYSLSAAEGRHGISREEQAAGIVEDGSLLLFASRKDPTPSDSP